ncbi:disulfide bond formation protein DsbC [Pusillimonas sp. T2]|nr:MULTISPECIES: DsbC family protein [unclassified Pusillimonas]OXR49004.1 disulfide bond formation protein DsbC [Pusillimonas sp. T2]ROT45864.1 disulfide bond formation protein DsbC [Pusillimonas sp. NJUB218]
MFSVVRRYLALVGFVLLSAMYSGAHAQPVPTQSTNLLADVKGRFETRFPGIEITAVRETPFPGLFEVQVGMDLLYSDADVSYVMQGSLIDAVSRVDLTSKRLADLSQVPFDELPFHLAIKQVKGNGERVLVAFEDPNCGYCKRLHQTLADVDNITVYTLLYPILSPDSHDKARNIWCAPDRVAAWRNWMLDGVVPPEAQCETPVQDILALGQQMTIRGTPALFFADGSRVNGAMPLEALVEKLDSVTDAVARR